MIFQQNYGSPGSSRSGSPPPGQAYPPNHPLSGSKHFCSICGDRASGKLKTFFLVKDMALRLFPDSRLSDRLFPKLTTIPTIE